jgi:hypothetical protein
MDSPSTGVTNVSERAQFLPVSTGGFSCGRRLARAGCGRADAQDCRDLWPT